MTASQLWTALLSGPLLTALATGAKFMFDAVTGRRVRHVSEGEAELRLAEMVKRVATDEVAAVTRRLERTEQRVHVLEEGLLMHVKPIIDWLDGGGQPPPPSVSEHLRALLRDVRRNH